MTASVADLSAEIPIDIWEEHINQIEMGKTYEFSPLQVKVVCYLCFLTN